MTLPLLLIPRDRNFFRQYAWKIKRVTHDMISSPKIEQIFPVVY